MRQLDEIMALTERVEQHVERGEWPEAGALDAERCRLLAGLFADPGAADSLASYRDVLQEILARNRQTIQRVQAERQRLQASVAASDRAMRAYDSNAGGDNLVWLRPVEVTPP